MNRTSGTPKTISGEGVETSADWNCLSPDRLVDIIALDCS